jgi:hypothetical protein
MPNTMRLIATTTYHIASYSTLLTKGEEGEVRCLLYQDGGADQLSDDIFTAVNANHRSRDPVRVLLA